jgi:lysophospholipase L1-like esterase
MGSLSPAKKGMMGISVALALIFLAEGAVRLSPVATTLDDPTEAQRQAKRLQEAYRLPAYLPLNKAGIARQGNAKVLVPVLEGLRAATIIIPKPAGLFRVVLLGDSTMFGIVAGVSQDKTLSFSPGVQLERLLKGKLKQQTPEVINMGLPGAISEVVLARTREAASMQPDVLIFYLGHNEGNERLIQSTLDPDFGTKGWLPRHSKLADLLMHWMTRPMTNPIGKFRGEILASNLAEMISLAKKSHALALVCLPIGKTPSKLSVLHNGVRRATLRAGAILIDLDKPFRVAAQSLGRPVASFFSDNVHPTAEGYGIMAQALAEAVLEAASPSQ